MRYSASNSFALELVLNALLCARVVCVGLLSFAGGVALPPTLLVRLVLELRDFAAPLPEELVMDAIVGDPLTLLLARGGRL